MINTTAFIYYLKFAGMFAAKDTCGFKVLYLGTNFAIYHCFCIKQIGLAVFMPKPKIYIN